MAVCSSTFESSRLRGVDFQQTSNDSIASATLACQLRAAHREWHASPLGFLSFSAHEHLLDGQCLLVAERAAMSCPSVRASATFSICRRVAYPAKSSGLL